MLGTARAQQQLRACLTFTRNPAVLHPEVLVAHAHEKFGEAVLSFRDADGREQEIAIDDVEGTEPEEGSSRTKIVLRNGAIVVVTGAVIAGAIAAIRYRRKHRQQG